MDARAPAPAPPSPAATASEHVWVRMLVYPRHTLPTAAAPVLVACGLAWRDGVFAAGPAGAALLAGWLIQLGGVLADNYNNLVRHPDDREHPQLVRALKTGTLTLGALRRAATACYLAAVAAGLALVWIGGLPALTIGIASIAASLAYSSEPLVLGDRALGDPLFFVFFGLVSVAGSYYVQAAHVLGPPFPLAVAQGTLPASAWLAGVPVAALTTCILVIDNIRDRDFDRAKGEITLAVVLGPRWSRVEYLTLVVLAYAVPVGLALAGWGGAVLLPLLSLPYAATVARDVWQRHTYEALVPMTPRAGQVVLLFSALFAVGLALAGAP